jgi:serine O-acetyltransferase
MSDEKRRQRLRGLTDRMVESYEELGGMNLAGQKNLPSQSTIVKILEDLLALLFPGYHGEAVSRDADLSLLVAARLDNLRRDLQDVIERTLTHCVQQGEHCRDLWPKLDGTGLIEDADRIKQFSGSLTLEYLEQLPEIRALLDTDVQAAYEGDPSVSNTEEIILCYPGVHAVMIHRLAHPLFLLGIPLLPRIMSEWAHSRTGVDIHPGADIGPAFFIDHGTGVVIGETTLIGRKVKIYQGVTLGALSFPRNADGSLVKGGKRHPTIGDRVTIYANATILGGETVIGEGAVIGGGAWITQSVAPGAVMTD